MLASVTGWLSLLLTVVAGCGSTDIMGRVTGDAASDSRGDVDVPVDAPVDTGDDTSLEADHWLLRIGDGTHTATDVLVLGDGSILVTGHQSGAFGRAACWLGRLSPEGGLMGQWMVSNLECSPYFRAAPTQDGGAVVVATAWGEGDQDVWVARLDPGLTIRWQQFLDRPGDQRYPGVETLPGGRILVVAVDDRSGDTDDLLVTLLTGDGEAVWSRTIGTPSREEFAGHAMGEGPEGRIYIAMGVKDPVTGYIDMGLVALDAMGGILWNVLVGDAYHDGAADLLVDELGVLVVGQTDTASLDSCASWVLRTDHRGNVLWQRAFNGGGCDAATWIVKNPAGGQTIGGGVHVETEDTFDYQMWLSSMDGGGHPGPPLLLGDESFQYAYSATVLGPDVIIVGQNQPMTGEPYTEMFVVRAGLSATFEGDCPLVDDSHAFGEGEIDATVRPGVDLMDVPHEVRAIPTDRSLQDAGLPWAVDCPD